MKRAVSMLLSAALLLGLLSACRNRAPSVSFAKEWTVSELAELALEHSGREDQEGLEAIDAQMDREWMTTYFEDAYDLQEPWEDAVVIRATGASAFEIAVLRMEDDSAAIRAATALMTYIFTRQGDFAGYAPAEEDMVARGGIMQNGPFAALFICPDPDGAYDAVNAALKGASISDPAGSIDVESDANVKGLRDFLVTYQGMDEADLELLDDSGPDALSAYIEENYGLSRDLWQECAIARGTGDSAFEVAVMRTGNDMMAGSSIRSKLNRYLDDRESAFQNDTEQLAMLRQAMAIEGVSSSMEYSYIVLLACEDAMDTALAFEDEAETWGFSYSDRHRTYEDADSSYPNRCLFTPPNKDDMSIYDTSAVLAAWEKNDPSELSSYDRDIYDQAQKTLGEMLRDGMSDYEKELAVYNWVVQNVDYDWTHQDRMKTTPRESFTPYGGLVNHTAVCLGYATTFQLLMDLAGVECITVAGAAYSSRQDHGWNMVKLNGEWYCVDVTWDANYREQGGRGRQEDWDYFNVTSDYMADTDHQWDYASVPEATAMDRGQG